MLEVIYNTQTKEVRVWNGSRFGRSDRDDHTTVIIDAPVPDKQPRAWLFDEKAKTLIANPAYEVVDEDKSARLSMAKEIVLLKARIDALETTHSTETTPVDPAPQPDK